MKKILSKLMEIAERENIRIIYAAEAGSRVWGYSTPTSDHDVKFIFVHPKNEYLKLSEPKDVITEKCEDIEFEGWDIKKALKLLYASNASLFEWCYSPIEYCRNPIFDDFIALLGDCYDRRKVAYHYVKLSKKKIAEIGEKDNVSPKDYLFAFRASVAAKWAVSRTDFPALNFETLMDVMLIDEKTRDEVEELKAKRLSHQTIDRSSLLDMHMGVMNFCTEGELVCGSRDFIRERTDVEKLNTAFQNIVERY